MLSIRYTGDPKCEIIEETIMGIVAIFAISSSHGIGIKKAIEKIQRAEKTGIISEESNENSSENSDEDKGEGSEEPEIPKEKEENGIITIYVNPNGIFWIKEKGKEIKIEVEIENNEDKLTKEEVIRLCDSTEEDMHTTFEEIDRIIQELNGEKDKPSMIEEMEEGIIDKYNRTRKDKGKNKEIYEDEDMEIETEDPFEKDINTSGIHSPKTSESEKSEEIETTESESEEEPEEPENLKNQLWH